MAKMKRDELMTLHGELTNKAFSIFEAKNHDYTGGDEGDEGDDPFANFRMSESLGVHPAIGILLRCGDKFQRIRAFANKGELKVKGESVEDAIIDVINYMILLGGLVREGEVTPQKTYVCPTCTCYVEAGKKCSTCEDDIQNIRRHMDAIPILIEFVKRSKRRPDTAISMDAIHTLDAWDRARSSHAKEKTE